VKGDGDLVDKHRDFYDEYLAVMDLAASIICRRSIWWFISTRCPR